MKSHWHGEAADLHEVLLGLIHSGNIVEGDAGVGLHLELGLGLAEGERVVAAGASRAALGAPRQQEQAAHQQQRERQVACDVPALSGFVPSIPCTTCTSAHAKLQDINILTQQ